MVGNLISRNIIERLASVQIKNLKMQSPRIITRLTGPWLLLLGSAASAAQPHVVNETGEPARIYRTPEERREAGLRHEITEWLSVSGLLELEDERQRNDFSDNQSRTEDQRAALTLQIGLDFTITQALRAEIILQAESDGVENHSQLDEGFLSAEIEDWGFEVGRHSLPFGEYYSHFVSGPLLEFGETIADSLIIDYKITDRVDLGGFVFDSDVGRQTDRRGLDWGAHIEFSSDDDALVLGASYLSDLAESDQKFLAEENNIFERRVPAWNAYGLYAFNKFEISVEAVRAIREFAEFESDRDKPSAYNIEIAYFPTTNVQVAFRIEHTDEFSDAPHQQYGISTTWRPVDNFSISVDYLRASFKSDFVLDDDGNELEHSNSVTAQLAMEW